MRALPLLALVLAGCPPTEKPADDTGGPDTAPEDTGPPPVA